MRKKSRHVKNLTERFKDIDQLEVVDVDVFNDVLPQGDIYIHELFGHCALIEGLMFFLANCQKQGISNIYPNKIKLISCNVDNIIQAVEETKNSISEGIKNSELLRNMLKGKGNSEAVKTITVL